MTFSVKGLRYKLVEKTKKLNERFFGQSSSEKLRLRKDILCKYTQTVYYCIINCLYQLCYKYNILRRTSGRKVEKDPKEIFRDSHGAVIFRMPIIPFEITLCPAIKIPHRIHPHCVVICMLHNTLCRHFFFPHYRSPFSSRANRSTQVKRIEREAK